jgi:hypothetical protein
MKNFNQSLSWIFSISIADEFFLPTSLASLHECPQEEIGPSRLSKQPRVKQRWHGNLQQDAHALVILLQIECIEPGT